MKVEFDLAAAVNDPVSKGKHNLARLAVKEEAEQLTPQARQKRVAKQARVPTRQGARAITAWVDEDVYRMVKLVGLDTRLTTQDLVLEALDLLFLKHGKGKMASRG
jgi:antitoxin-like ribbon-helix-helix protein